MLCGGGGLHLEGSPARGIEYSSTAEWQSNLVAVIQQEPFPLHVAIARGADELVESLIESNAADVINGKVSGITPLGMAIVFNRPEWARRLIEKGAAVDELAPDHSSLLHLAALGGHAPVVSILLRHQASLSRVNRQGYTPWQLSKELGYTHIEELLK